MMQPLVGHRYPSLLFLLVTLITISISAGLNCSYCTDVRKAEVLKNTVSGLTLREQSNTFSNPQCETAVNGEHVSGVDVGLCNDNPINSSKEYRCVHYSGQVVASVIPDWGNSSGEVRIRYEGTYRACFLEDINANGSCVKETVLLPEGNELRRLTLETIPLVQNNASVVFRGQRCVSHANGTFPSRLDGISNAIVKESRFQTILLLLLIYSFG